MTVDYRAKIHQKMSSLIGERYYSYGRVNKQINDFQKNRNLSPEDIYKTLEYWYDIKHGDVSKAKGGIGIVDYVCGEALEYWDKIEKDKDNINEWKIDSMIHEEEPVVIPRPKWKKPKIRYYELD